VRRHFLAVTASTLINALSGLPTAAVEMQPGLWEVTTIVDHNGAVSTRSPRLKCINAEGPNAAGTNADFGFSADARAMLSARFGQDACKLVEAKNGKDLITWRLQCTGKLSAEQEGSVRFDNPQHYTATIRSSITSDKKTVTSTVTTEGRHRGDCPR
jgi:hypothetical protein